jgi:hypothetical protein
MYKSVSAFLSITHQRAFVILYIIFSVTTSSQVIFASCVVLWVIFVSHQFAFSCQPNESNTSSSLFGKSHLNLSKLFIEETYCFVAFLG